MHLNLLILLTNTRPPKKRTIKISNECPLHRCVCWIRLLWKATLLPIVSKRNISEPREKGVNFRYSRECQGFQNFWVKSLGNKGISFILKHSPTRVCVWAIWVKQISKYSSTMVDYLSVCVGYLRHTSFKNVLQTWWTFKCVWVIWDL